MSTLALFVDDIYAARLRFTPSEGYQLRYLTDYQGAAIALSLPIKEAPYQFEQLPAFFEGLLPEGVMFDALLRRYKLDKSDHMGQLKAIGGDVIGNVTMLEATDE